MRRISTQFLIATLIASSAMLLSACDGGRGYSRGVFHGIVIDKSEDEIVGKLGKPEAVEKIGDVVGIVDVVLVACLVRHRLSFTQAVLTPRSARPSCP